MDNKQPPGPERLLKVPEVALRLALSRSKTYELMNAGSLPSVSIVGMRTRRVREADLDAFIRSQQGRTPAPTKASAQEVGRVGDPLHPTA